MPAPELPSIVSGSLFNDKWILEEQIGDGGTATVYAARHARNGLRVAIKVLHRELSFNEENRKRFVHEGYASNRVSHPGVVRALDDGVSPDGSIYLVLERLEGGTLQDLADQHGGALTLATLAGVARTVLDIMRAAHDAGIVHRDLKAENVFICTDGSVKVMDFGLARVRERTSGPRITTNLTNAMGTPAFMAPEQALGLSDEVDQRSDVYGLGASFFTMLTGRLVHEGRSVQEILVLASTRRAPPIRTFLPDLPEGVASVIDRALAFDRGQRFADAGEMAEAWAQATSFLGAPPAVQVPRAAPPRERASMVETAAPVETRPGLKPPAKRRVGSIALVATVLAGGVMALGVALWLLGRDGAPASPTAATADTETASTVLVTPVASHPTEASAQPAGAAAPATAEASSEVGSAAVTADDAPPPVSTPTQRTRKPTQPKDSPTAKPGGCAIDPFTMRCK